MTGSRQLLAAATDTGTGEAVAFWILAPVAVLGALGDAARPQGGALARCCWR